MRPAVALEPALRPRKSASNDMRGSGFVPGPEDSQMTFFLTDESQLEGSRRTGRRRSQGEDSNYGVQSFQLKDEDAEDTGASKMLLSEASRRQSTATNASSATVKKSKPPTRHPSNTTLSQPLTPLNTDSPAPSSSIPSPVAMSLRSFRISDTDSILESMEASLEMQSSDLNTMSAESSDPQLIMPSIMMPSRRPFTDQGKNMGRLKVLVAGDSGVGKTSLIKSIVQACEDIVHVDPAVPVEVVSERSHSDDVVRRTKHIAEVYASTKPYPTWWSEVDEGGYRRKRIGDTVLERNLCFVDTPGYGSKSKSIEVIDKVVDYIESQLQRTAAGTSMTNHDMISLLTGQGGAHVDVVFYLILQKLKPIDVEYLRRLAALTHVVPIITKSDTLSPVDASALKVGILKDLENLDIRPFNFGFSREDIESGREQGPPWAISSAASTDIEHMDASLMMNSEYVQPLAPSDLKSLVSEVFKPESIAWLKHSAARKFLHWRNGTASSPEPGISYPMQSMLLSRRSSNSGALYSPGSAYAVAKFNDHSRREERLAQVRLARWAADLQRSLQNEKERYEAIARGQRAAWLQERLGECVSEGSLVPTAIAQDMYTGKAALGSKLSLRPIVDPRDPMGLLEWTEMVRKRGWLVVQILGSFGVLGGAAIWILKNWDQDEGLLLRHWRSWADE